MNVQAKFFGRANEQSTPASIRYRIKDVTNDRIVTDWTAVTPAHSIDIEISAQENAIYQDGSRPFQRFETRVLVVQANYDTETQCSNEIQYMIKNLRGFDS